MKTKQRGFEKISMPEFAKAFAAVTSAPEVLYQMVKIPVRKTIKSAGYDITTCYDFDLAPGESILVNTGLKAYMQENEFLGIYIRSSLGIRKDIMLKNQVGIIDADYYNNCDNEGHIRVGLINHGQTIWHVKAGDAIAQGIFQMYLVASDDDNMPKNIRTGGIGSTDKTAV